MALTSKQLEQFQHDGFLVLKDFASSDEIRSLNARAKELLSECDPATFSTVFSTKNQTKDAYFLDSAASISYFWEEKAKDQNGNLIKPKEESINKIGHALHDLDPTFMRWSRSPKIQRLAHSLGFKEPVPVQSMLIFKQPGIGGEVAPHQDATFLGTDPDSVIGLWLALEDATVDNGCLWSLPGSHTAGLKRRFVRKPDNSLSFEDIVPAQVSAVESKDAPLDAFVPVPVPAGSLIILHGYNMHYSKENVSPLSRHAYTLHLVEAHGCSYLPSNWLQRPPSMPFTSLYK